MGLFIEQHELQRFFIFCVCVVNKTESHARRVSDALSYDPLMSPFGAVRKLIQTGKLKDRLVELRSGQYTRIERTLTEAVTSGIDLDTCTVEDLEAIHGIGPKTARYFLLRTRKDARYAALDTHILKWLRSRGYDAPVSTPTGERYRKLEKIFLAEADRLKVTPSELDYYAWTLYSQKP